MHPIPCGLGVESPSRAVCPNRKNSRRGNNLIEFSLVFILFMAMIFAAFDFSYGIFVKATLHHAVREGVRFAISGRTLPGMPHDPSVKQIVKQNALSLLNSEENAATIHIDYYTATGFGATANNAAGNIVVVSVRNYQVRPVAPLLRASTPYNITVTALDKMEPFPGAPPPRENP